MVELDERVGLHLIDQRFRHALEVVHLGAHRILIVKHVLAHRVESVVENLENALDLVLVHIQLFHKRLFLLGVLHLQLNELLLQSIRDACKDTVSSVLLVIRLAPLAIERVVDLATEFDLFARFLAVELLWVEGEIIAIVQSTVILRYVPARFKLVLESYIVRALHELVTRQYLRFLRLPVL